MPILIRFFSFPEDATFWDLLNSPFLVAIIATAIGIRLSAKLSDTQADANTALRIAQSSHEIPTVTEANGELDESDNDEEFEEAEPAFPASRTHDIEYSADDPIATEPDFAELPPEPPQYSSADEAEADPNERRSYRISSAVIAEKARHFIALKISADKDKRHQRTYKKVSRSNPLALAIALNERGQLTNEQTSALIEIFEVWHGYSKGQAVKNRVPRSVLRRLRSAWERVGAE